METTFAVCGLLLAILAGVAFSFGYFGTCVSLALLALWCTGGWIAEKVHQVWQKLG
jgi:uncharacterized membrane protein